MDTSRRRRRHTAGWSLIVGLGAAGCNFGGSPSADAHKQPPQITDEMPTVAPLASVPEAPGSRGGVVTSSDDSVARVDRILRDRAQAQRAADDIKELRDATRDRPGELAAHPLVKTSPPLNVPPGEPPAYDPATDAAAVAQMTGTGTAPSDAPQAMADSGNVPLSTSVAASQEDRGDINPHSADAMMMSQTQSQLTGPLRPTPFITRQSSVDPMIALEQTFAGRVANDPTNLANQFDYQLVEFLREQQVPRPNDMAGLTSEDQSLLSAMCDALNNFRSVVRAQPNALTSEKARPFVEMAARIASQSDLAVSSPRLCSEVAAFGNYTELDQSSLVAGAKVPAVFYCEVDGFEPMLNDQAQYETKLSLELKFYSASRSVLMWSVPAMTVNDVSRRQRRDFFVAKMIELPANLPADTYLLKARVKDLQSNRMAEKTLQFTLSSAAAPAR